MCGVIAYRSEKPSAEDMLMLRNLFIQSGIRGLHSCGFMAAFDGARDDFGTRAHNIGVVNSYLRGMEELPAKLIGHTRYSTSGDWKNHDNNQPLILKGISLAFNGCIHMGLREEYEAVYGKKYETDNDGEIFARMVLEGEDWEKFVAEGSFSFAGAFLHRGELWILRNKNRPLWTAKRGPATFVASTKDILARAGLKQGLDAVIEEVPPCRALQL